MGVVFVTTSTYPVKELNAHWGGECKKGPKIKDLTSTCRPSHEVSEVMILASFVCVNEESRFQPLE